MQRTEEMQTHIAVRMLHATEMNRGATMIRDMGCRQQRMLTEMFTCFMVTEMVKQTCT